MVRLAIFASGSGSNAEQIVRFFDQHNSVQVACIISNKPDALVLERANRLGVLSAFFTNEAFRGGAEVVDFLQKKQVDFVVLAGFLLKIPQPILEAFPSRIINIHPALLPKFGGKGMYGMNVHRAVIEAHEVQTGITIHYVDEHYDRGDIIFQARCPVFSDDTPEGVASRVHELEHRYFPKVIERVVLALPEKLGQFEFTA